MSTGTTGEAEAVADGGVVDPGQERLRRWRLVLGAGRPTAPGASWPGRTPRWTGR